MAKTKRVSDEEFSLDTSGFDEAAKLCADLAEKLEMLKSDMDIKKSNLMFSWAGDARNNFEKKYRLLSHQMRDIGDVLRDLSEEIYEKEAKYIEADTKLAKQIKGKQSRF